MEDCVFALQRASGIVNSNRPLDEMLGEIAGLALQAVNCAACLVYLIDRESRELVLRASQPPHVDPGGPPGLSAPLVSSGEAIGAIHIHHRERREHSVEETALLTFLGEQMGGAAARSMLEEDNARLRAELESRKLLERAKGILQKRHGVSEEEAYLRLRNQSRRLRKPMRELAEAVILAESVEHDVTAL